MTREELQIIANAAREGALIANKPFLTPAEAALFLGCSEAKIYKMIAAGTLRAGRLRATKSEKDSESHDKKRMIDRSDLLSLVTYGL